MSMKREEEAGNARDTPPSRKRIGKKPWTSLQMVALSTMRSAAPG